MFSSWAAGQVKPEDAAKLSPATQDRVLALRAPRNAPKPVPTTDGLNRQQMLDVYEKIRDEYAAAHPTARRGMQNAEAVAKWWRGETS